MTLDLVLASLTVRWLAGWYLGGRARTLRTASAGTGACPAAPAVPAMSVIIPARDEAESLPALLGALAVQTSPPAQVIVVDDQSTDETATIALGAGATVLRSSDIPQGWLGKPWACAQGAALATGDLLVFLDADTVPSPDFLVYLAAAVRQRRGLLSVAPYHEVRGPFEFASALFNLVALMGAGVSSMRKSARVTGAFGPCMALRAEDYAAIGGHAAVSGDILDDMALARICARHALPVVAVVGGEDLKYRMYPKGFRQLVEGWSKNFAAGAGGTPVLRLVAIVAWMSGLIETGWVSSLAIAGMIGSGAILPWPDALFYGLFAFQLWFMLRRIGNFGAVAIAHPLATMAFVGIFARSAFVHARGQVTWKGRSIAISSARRPGT